MNKRQRKKAAKYWFARELRKRFRREAKDIRRFVARAFREEWPAPSAHAPALIQAAISIRKVNGYRELMDAELSLAAGDSGYNCGCDG